MADQDHSEEVANDQLATTLLTFVGILEANKLKLVDAMEDAVIAAQFDDPETIDDEEIKRKLASRGPVFRQRFETKTYTKAVNALESLAESFEHSAGMVRDVIATVRKARGDGTGT